MRCILSVFLLFLLLAGQSIAQTEGIDFAYLGQKIEDSAEKLTAYSYTRTFEEGKSYSNQSFSNEIGTATYEEGTVDLRNMTAWLRTTTLGSDKFNEFYFINDTEYMNTGGNWTQDKVLDSAVAFGIHNEMSGQVNMIQASEMEIIGSDTFDGVDCYVIAGPALEREAKMAIANNLRFTYLESPIPLPDELGDFNGNINNTGLMNASSLIQTAWIAKDTLLPLRIDLRLILHANPEIMGLTTGDFNITSRVNESTTYYGFDEPVNIVLPDEAIDAPAQKEQVWAWSRVG